MLPPLLLNIGLEFESTQQGATGVGALSLPLKIRLQWQSDEKNGRQQILVSPFLSDFAIGIGMNGGKIDSNAFHPPPPDILLWNLDPGQKIIKKSLFRFDLFASD